MPGGGGNGCRWVRVQAAAYIAGRDALSPSCPSDAPSHRSIAVPWCHSLVRDLMHLRRQLPVLGLSSWVATPLLRSADAAAMRCDNVARCDGGSVRVGKIGVPIRQNFRSWVCPAARLPVWPYQPVLFEKFPVPRVLGGSCAWPLPHAKSAQVPGFRYRHVGKTWC